jgi:hypothetical protein
VIEAHAAGTEVFLLGEMCQLQIPVKPEMLVSLPEKGLRPLTESVNFPRLMDLNSEKRILCESSISHVFIAFCTVSSKEPFGHSCFSRVRLVSNGIAKS